MIISTIKVFPSPASDHIQIEGLSHYINSFNILNSKGEIVMSKNTIVNQKKFDISKLSSGVYFIQLNNVDNVVIGVQKFLKQ